MPLALLAILCSSAAGADTLLVTSADDSGPGTLRAALLGLWQQTPPHHISIEVPGADNVLTLQSPLPFIEGPETTISGANSPGFTIDGGGQHAIIRASPGLSLLELSDLRLIRGRAPQGGCMDVALDEDSVVRVARMRFEGCEAAGTAFGGRGGAIFLSVGQRLEVHSSHFIDNIASGSDFVQGGAIHTGAPELEIRNSVFTGNGVVSPAPNNFRTGGAVSMLGAFDAPTPVLISGSRFEDNWVDSGSSAFGGALRFGCRNCPIEISDSYFRGNSAGLGGALAVHKNFEQIAATAILRNVTLHDNHASHSGGAIHVRDGGIGLQHVTLQDNGAPSGAHLASFKSLAVPIIGNTVFGSIDSAAGGAACDAGAAVASVGTRGGNVFGDDSCGTLAVGALALSGGEPGVLDASDEARPVLVFPLGSAVIDAGDNSHCLDRDARGTQRPLDGDGDNIATCDAGAVEHPRWLPAAVFADGFDGAGGR